MAQSTESTTYTAFPNQLFDDLVQGKIDNTMFNLLIWLYRRGHWKNGIVTRASSQQMIAELWGGWAYEKNPPSERTIQEKLRRLVQMGYVVSHHTAGRRGTYSISINNYPALTPAGEEIILRPTITKSLDDVLIASCDDNGGESSGESSADPAVSLPRTHSTTPYSPNYHPTPEVSERVSERESLATLAPARSFEITPNRKKVLEEEGWVNLIHNLMPRLPESKLNSELSACLWLFNEGYTPDFVIKLWVYNHTHKSGKYLIHSLSKLMKALDSTSDGRLLDQYDSCTRHPCRRCKPSPTPPAPSQEEQAAVPAGSGQAFENEDLSPCGLLFTDRNCQCQLPDRPIAITHPRFNGSGHRKLVDIVAGRLEPRQAFEIEEDI